MSKNSEDIVKQCENKTKYKSIKEKPGGYILKNHVFFRSPKSIRQEAVICIIKNDCLYDSREVLLQIKKGTLKHLNTVTNFFPKKNSAKSNLVVDDPKEYKNAIFVETPMEKIIISNELPRL